MRLLVLTVMLSFSLVLGGASQFSWAQGVQEKVKASSDKAAKDYMTHGLLLAGEGRDEDAAKSFRRAISLRPDWAEAHSLLGSALARAGNFKEAEAELRKAVTLKPDYAEGWNYLGQFYKEQRQDKEAQEAFNKAKQLAR
ncbi:MAG: tetratricopeptide repeat protein [Desulfobaccales bacterium]